MKLKEMFSKFRNEIVSDLAECMCDRTSDEDKAGKVLSMTLKADKMIGGITECLDELQETNQKLLAKNEELLRKLEDLQKMQNMQLDVTNGLYGRFDHLDNSILSMNAKSSKKE